MGADAVPDPMVFVIDVTRSLGLNGVIGDSNGTFVVTIHGRGGLWVAEYIEDLAN